MALLLTTGAAVTAFAVSSFNSTAPIENQTSFQLDQTPPPELLAWMEAPENLTRGNTGQFEIFVTNVGNTSASVIEVDWILSPGLETVYQNDNCTGLAPNNSCVAVVFVDVTGSTELGRNAVRGELRYG